MLLFLSDIAGSEIILVLVFILIFFGSKSIPGIARSMGRTMRQIKDASQDMQNEIKKSGLDIKKDLNLKGMIQDSEKTLRQPLDQMSDNINELVDSSRKPYKPVTPPPVQSVEKTEVVEKVPEVEAKEPKSTEEKDPQA